MDFSGSNVKGGIGSIQSPFVGSIYHLYTRYSPCLLGGYTRYILSTNLAPIGYKLDLPPTQDAIVANEGLVYRDPRA